jgi:hypothetical protein
LNSQKKITTHPDNDFVIHRNNVFFITGMSNKSWENDMKDKIPNCFSGNVFHHGKLRKLERRLKNLKNAIIINDEIDTGDIKDQRLHKILRDSEIFDIKYMEENNIRFVFVSATMYNENRDLNKWGDKHYTYRMTIPDTYIGHKEFLERKIIEEYYRIEDDKTADKWIKEDIIQKYGNDYRVHLIRIDKNNVDYIEKACSDNKINFKNHHSDDRIEHKELSDIFDNIENHTVIAVKGFYRRANLIPNNWKKKIGTVHERYTQKFDVNVQIQGLVGRMCGYWKQVIENGHLTGPYRTSVEAMKQYETWYNNPNDENKYKTSRRETFVNCKNVKHMEYTDDTNIKDKNKRIPIIIELKEDDAIFRIKNKSREQRIHQILQNDEKYVKLLNFINSENCKCTQITMPIKDGSYERHIDDVVRASEQNSPFSIDVKNNNKDKVHWQVFIDNRKYRLCLVLWVVNTELYEDDVPDIQEVTEENIPTNENEDKKTTI